MDELARVSGLEPRQFTETERQESEEAHWREIEIPVESKMKRRSRIREESR